MNEENTKYQLLDYKLYEKRLDDALKNEELGKIGIQKKLWGYTKYGYEISEYIVGNGPKDLFIVGGTHGSEIISVDFVTQFMNNIPNLQDYDPSLVTLHIIPNQNPEGFDITTQTIKAIDETKLEQESKDYYIRYRLDDLLNRYLNLINTRFNEMSGVLITPSVFIETIKNTFESNEWKLLIDPVRGVPDLANFAYIFENIVSKNTYDELQSELFIKVNNVMKDTTNVYFKVLVDRLSKGLFSNELISEIFAHNKVFIDRNQGGRLYQERFENEEIKDLQSEQLERDVTHALKEHGVVSGAQAKFDPNGEFVNLNKNRPDNPGIEQMRSGEIKFGPSPANNILDNAVGPIGTPTVDPEHFEYTAENKILLSLIEKSNEEGRLAGVLLYHGTGGGIYSIPFATDDNAHIFPYNENLAEAYSSKTGYKEFRNPNDNGVGDMLRKKYPGVILVELSRMTGNPIAPYGDKDKNYYSTMISNFDAVNELIKRINESQNKPLA